MCSNQSTTSQKWNFAESCSCSEKLKKWTAASVWRLFLQYAPQATFSVDGSIKSWLVKANLTITQLECAAGYPRPDFSIDIIQQTFSLVPWCKTYQVILSKTFKSFGRHSQECPEVLWRHLTYFYPYRLCMIQLPNPHALKCAVQPNPSNQKQALLRASN